MTRMTGVMKETGPGILSRTDLNSMAMVANMWRLCVTKMRQGLGVENQDGVMCLFFLPGDPSGQGLCTASGALDNDALFQTLAEKMTRGTGRTCYRVSWQTQYLHVLECIEIIA